MKSVPSKPVCVFRWTTSLVGTNEVLGEEHGMVLSIVQTDFGSSGHGSYCSATELKALDELHGQEYGVVNGDHSRPIALAALHQFQDSGGCPEMRVRRLEAQIHSRS